MDSTTPTGYLRIKVSSGGGAYPVPGAIVLIKNADAEGGSSGVIYSLRTDSSGLTVTVPLPAKLLTGEGGAEEFTPYNVEVIKEGYYRSMIDGVQAYDGVSAVLPVNLVPVGYGDAPYGAGKEMRM